MQQDPRHTVNPLRPYYIPPSVGTATEASITATASASKSAGQAFSFPDIDINYSDYIPEASPSLTGSARKILDQALWRYTSTVLAQPFEVAKIILQTRLAQDDEEPAPPRRSPAESPYQRYEAAEEDSDDDEPSYFTSNTSFERPQRRGRTPRRSSTPPKDPIQPKSTPEVLQLKNPHSLLDALSALTASSGPLATWRATNSTFIYTVLSQTLQTFFRGLLAAALGISEADVLVPISTGAIPDTSILSSTSPVASILVTTGAAVVAGLILAPIDAARTRLILTPSTHEPRTLLGTLRTLSPSWLIPTHLIPITLLTSTLPTIISTSTPLILRTYLRLDPNMNPAAWSFATFFASAFDLSVKFPLETVLRRAQIATWTSPSYTTPRSSSKRKAITTIVPVPQTYRGIVPTIWSIMREEGYSESQKDKAAALLGKVPRRKRKGQGLQGLYRGWRVGLWGLVGVWGTAFVSGLQGGTESVETPGVHGGKF